MNGDGFYSIPRIRVEFSSKGNVNQFFPTRFPQTIFEYTKLVNSYMLMEYMSRIDLLAMTVKL